MSAGNLDISPKNWFVAARSDQLPQKGLLRRLILSKPYVLFRDSQGAVHAFADRCPHKGIPLSMGQVRGDEIQCRYHGWKFDRKGACTDVPCHAPNEKLPSCRLKGYRVVEQDEWIWIHLTEAADSTALPPSYPKTKSYGWFELHNVMKAPVDLILENGVDCAHTGYVHPGLYRSEPQNFIRARMKFTPTGVRIETLGEKSQSKTRDVRSLLSREKTITHSDELILPHTVKVDYTRSDGYHVITILICTPEDENTTRVYTRMGVYGGKLTWPATRFIRYVTKKVVAQDKEVLESQAVNLRLHGERDFKTVTADLPTNWLQRAFVQYNAGKFPPDGEPQEREISYKL